MPLILVAMASFAVQDLAVKLVSDSVSIWQLQLLRSIAVLALLAVYARALRRVLLPTRWRWPLIRSVFMTGAYFFFYASLPLMTMSQAGAAFYVGPLLITVLAALLLGEPIGPRRIAAVAVGFLGVLLIVRPGLEGWTPAALLPVAAATCYAFGVVMTRWRCSDQAALGLTAAHNILYTGLGALGCLILPLVPFAPATRAALPFITGGWEPLTATALLLVIATAVTHMIGMLCSLEAYRRAEASRIAPFEYAYLLVLPVFDLAVFGMVPALPVLLGALLILASGGFVAWREGRPARPRVAAKGEVPWTPVPPDAKKGP